ncbi:hypothetical protein L7F22_061769 [Adiantum nelumboides]|nr:hypothetical protein [Adiantum nelumboides]
MDPLLEQRSILKAQAEAAALILSDVKKLHDELHEGLGLGNGQGLGPKLKQMPNEARPAEARAKKGKIKLRPAPRKGQIRPDQESQLVKGQGCQPRKGYEDATTKNTLPVEVSSTSLHSNSSKWPKSGASFLSKDTFVAIDKSNDNHPFHYHECINLLNEYFLVKRLDVKASWKVQYSKQTRFCFTRHDLHEEYGLSLKSKLYQHLSDEDVTDEDWLAVFTKKREKGARIFLNMVRPEYEEECSSINLQIVAKVEQMLAARKSTLESVKSTLNAAQVQLQEKHQSMWKIEGTSSAAAVLQGQLTELHPLKDSMEGGACGASSFEVMIIDAKIIALSSALVALGADASNSKIRDNVDRIEVPNLKVDPTPNAHTIDTDMHSNDQSTPGRRESSSLASDKTLREECSHVAIDKTLAAEVEPSQQTVGEPQPKEEPMEDVDVKMTDFVVQEGVEAMQRMVQGDVDPNSPVFLSDMVKKSRKQKKHVDDPDNPNAQPPNIETTGFNIIKERDYRAPVGKPYGNVACITLPYSFPMGAPKFEMSRIFIMRSPTFLVIFLLICCINVIQAQQIPNEANSAIIIALKDKGFNTVALVLPYLIKFLVAPVTFLIPTDQAIAGERIQESQLVQIAQFHMVKNNFSFADFQLLPVNTYLPTLLLLGGVSARVKVRNNSADNYTLNNARIVEKDICPSSVASFVTCQEIAQILQTPLS